MRALVVYFWRSQHCQWWLFGDGILMIYLHRRFVHELFSLKLVQELEQIWTGDSLIQSTD